MDNGEVTAHHRLSGCFFLICKIGTNPKKLKTICQIMSHSHMGFYPSLSVSNTKESLEKLQHSVMAVSAWMTGSKLKLNPSQTDFFLIGTKLQSEKFLNISPCLILSQDTNPSASAKNLGVVSDSSLNFRKHISQTCRACFYHIRDLRRIRKSLCLDVLKSKQANWIGTGQ